MRSGYEFISINDYGQAVVRLFSDVDELISFLRSRGFKKMWELKKVYHSGNAFQDYPMFKGLVGPMSGNHNSIRYETPEVWERLSR